MNEVKKIGNDNQSAAPKIPAEIAFLFKDPFLLVGEDRGHYNALLMKIASVVNPEDAIVWVMFVKDFADFTWEIYMLRRVKAAMIDIMNKPAVQTILESTISQDMIGFDGDRKLAAARKTEEYFADVGARKLVRQHWSDHDIDCFSITGQAYVLRIAELEKFDGLLTSLEKRRASLIHGLDEYRRGLGQRLHEVTESYTVAEIGRIPVAPE